MKKYWQSFGELNESETVKQQAQNEFKENLLPIEELDSKGLLDAKSPRRDFLKYLGFSTLAATVAAACEQPVRKVIPYLNRPDNVIPGVANYYATTYVNGGDTISVVVKQRDGRPIKIEGNELSSLTKGGTTAQAQASVLDLYDMTRLRYPMEKNGSDFKEIPSFDAADKLIGAALAGKTVVLITSTVNSPSTKQVIAGFLAKNPGSKHIQYDEVSYSGMLLANEACYGKRAIPSYQFNNAKTIVSLSADFLGTWLNPAEFSNQYASTKKVTNEKAEAAQHIQFESMLSLTGSNADDRFTHKPSQTGAVALALAAKLGVAGISAPAVDAGLQKGIDLAAAALSANKGASLVVCGSNDVNIQIIVNAINETIGANGKTINWANPSNLRAGIDADMEDFVKNAASNHAVLIYGCNPAYSYSNSKAFTDALAKTTSISFNGTMDETTELCKYIIPSHHWLESWGDAEPKAGYISMMQPTINPLFKTRAWQDSLLKWAGNASDYNTYCKNYWTTKLGGSDAYNKALQDGVVEPTSTTVAGASFSGGKVADAAGKIAAIKAGNVEVVLYEKVGMGSGKQANNPWLQELPDPVSKVTWDNYAIISPEMAKSLIGIDTAKQIQADKYEVTPEKPVITVTVNGKSKDLPALILPGIEKNTIAIAVGYGRQSAAKDKTKEYIGLSANGAGVNVYPFVSFDGTTNQYNATATVAKSKAADYPLAQTQVHGSNENRPVIYETSVKAYNTNPEALMEEVRAELKNVTYAGGTDFRKDATIYPDLMEEKKGIKWGMNIDLNTCTGCSACVVACTAENNVSVVGKIQVQKAHEMHWLRIDRYFSGEDMNNPDVVFQPMLCQHCDNAPCENVCPVAATNHSSEGINQMTYNRCIGTRYCANNCPYKVRRFNWLDYTGADSFDHNQDPLRGTYLNDSVFQMNDDLTRMVLNPDVTVRSRGVIEKCSFCVQRTQAAKLDAKKEQNPELIRNVKTACMQACPTHAISFGNVYDNESEVAKARAEQSNRKFYVMEQLHVLPNVSYLAKLKNTDRDVAAVREEHEAHEVKAVQGKKEETHH